MSEWTFGNHGVATIASHDIATIALTRGEGPAVFPALLEGRTPSGRDEMVIGSMTLASIHRRVGQTVIVALLGGEYANPNPDGFNFVLVGMTHGAAERDSITRLVSNPEATRLCGCAPVTDQRPADVSNYARVKSTPAVLAGVLALLAVVTVAHLLVTSIRRRRRDLAVLKRSGSYGVRRRRPWPGRTPSSPPWRCSSDCRWAWPSATDLAVLRGSPRRGS